MHVGRWKVVVFMSTVMATVTIVLAILLEAGTIAANAPKGDSVVWRVGVYGSLATYVANGVLVVKLKETWSRASLALMLVFTATRFISWFWNGIFSVMCAPQNKCMHGAHIASRLSPLNAVHAHVVGT